jgi:hypothetical protein
MKYIGITGKRGSGRETLAWLLGQTLQFKDKLSFDEYQQRFKTWTDAVKKSKDCIGSSNYYVLESFGGIILDSIRLTIPVLYKLDLTQGSPDLGRKFDINTLTLDCGDTTVGEFIILYADKTMKANFGKKFWVNIAEQMARDKENYPYATEKYIIYWDVKTDEEAEYIKRHDGIFIKVTCPERLRSGGYNTIKSTEPDYKIRLHKDFVDDCQQIWDLAHSLSSD